MLFDVKGWNVSAPLKTERNSDDEGSGKNSRKRKRRRAAEDALAATIAGPGLASASASEPTPGLGMAADAKTAFTPARHVSDAALMSADAIGKLWERHVESKKDKRKRKKKDVKAEAKVDGESSSRRGQKTDDNGTGETGGSNGVSILKHVSGNLGGEDGGADVQMGKKSKRKRASENGVGGKNEDEKSTGVEKRKKITSTNETSEISDKFTEQRGDGTTAAAAPTTSRSIARSSTGLTPLQNQMREKLISARFRQLNETLYTSPSAKAVELFKAEPDLFDEYHIGFARQVAAWPSNPVDDFVKMVLVRGNIGLADRKGQTQRSQKKNKNKNKNKNVTSRDMEEGDSQVLDLEPKSHMQQSQKHEHTADILPSSSSSSLSLEPLPRTRGTCTIVDIGCGTAPFANALQPHLSRLRLFIRNFDLVASLDSDSKASPVRIEHADMCALPVANATVDIAVLCLALMGTNWPEAIDEAWRVLRWKGELWIAEPKSRFAHAGGSGKRDAASGIGRVKSADTSNKIQKNISSRREKKRNAVHGKVDNVADNDDYDDNDDEDDDKDEDLADSISPPVVNDTGGGGGGSGKDAANATDLIPFLTVLHKRGFVLARDDGNYSNNSNNNNDKKGDFEGCLDTSNKMFVTMRVVKANMPVRGKNKDRKQKQQEEKQSQQQLQRRKKQGQRGKWRTVVRDEDVDGDGGGGKSESAEDASVLKACVYKLR